MLKGGQWLKAEMIDGMLSSKGMSGQGFSTSEEIIRMSLNPIGEFTYQQTIRQRNISMVVDVTGTCEELDS